MPNFLIAGGSTIAAVEKVPSWYLVGRSANNAFIIFDPYHSNTYQIYMRWPGRLERILGTPTSMTLIEWRQQEGQYEP